MKDYRRWNNYREGRDYMVLVNIDRVAYKSKPLDNGLVVNRLKKTTPTQITARELAEDTAKGHTWTPAVFKKGTKDASGFLHSQSFALDFDNADEKKHKTTGDDYITIEQVLENPFFKENASYIYKTFSYKKSWEKFRVVILFDKVLGKQDYIDVMERIGLIFPQLDGQTIDVARHFFGGKGEPIEINYNNVLNVEKFLGREVTPVDEVSVEYYMDSAFDTGDHDVRFTQMKQVRGYIRQGNVKELKKIMKEITQTKWNVASYPNAEKRLKEIPLDKLFGVKEGELFHSLFRRDNNPSANFYRVKNTELWLYKDFGNGDTFNIIQLFQKLMRVPTSKHISKKDAVDFILSLLDATIKETENLRRIREWVEAFSKEFKSPAFIEQNPNIQKVFNRKTRQDIVDILTIMETSTYETEDGKEVNYTWMSNENIAKELGYKNKKTPNKILNLMALTGIITDVPEDEIEDEILVLIEKSRTHHKFDGEWVERKNPRQYRSSVWKINIGGEEFFTELVERVNALVEKGYTRKALTYGWVQLSFGKEEADRLYPQDTNKDMTGILQYYVDMMVKVGMPIIQEHGYIIVNDFQELVREHIIAEEVAKSGKPVRRSKVWSDQRFKQCIGTFIDDYALERKSLTNDLRAELNITHLKPTARPKILMYA